MTVGVRVRSRGAKGEPATGTSQRDVVEQGAWDPVAVVAGEHSRTHLRLHRQESGRQVGRTGVGSRDAIAGIVLGWIGVGTLLLFLVLAVGALERGADSGF